MGRVHLKREKKKGQSEEREGNEDLAAVITALVPVFGGATKTRPDPAEAPLHAVVADHCAS